MADRFIDIRCKRGVMCDGERLFPANKDQKHDGVYTVKEGDARRLVLWDFADYVNERDAPATGTLTTDKVLGAR